MVHMLCIMVSKSLDIFADNCNKACKSKSSIQWGDGSMCVW